jgi:hypothetical protein
VQCLQKIEDTERRDLELVMVNGLDQKADTSMSSVISQLYQVKSGYENMVSTLIRHVKRVEKATPFPGKPTTERFEETDQYHKLSTRNEREVPLSASTQSRKNLISPGTGEPTHRCRHCNGKGLAVSSHSSDVNRMRSPVSPMDPSGAEQSKVALMHATISQLQSAKRNMSNQLTEKDMALAKSQELVR